MNKIIEQDITLSSISKENKLKMLDVLEKDIKCQELKVCVTDCEDCQYYITRPKMAEVHKEILKILSD